MHEDKKKHNRKLLIMLLVLLLIAVIVSVIFPLEDTDTDDIVQPETVPETTGTVSDDKPSYSSETLNDTENLVSPEELNPHLADILKLYPNSVVPELDDTDGETNIPSNPSAQGTPVKPDISFISLYFDGSVLKPGITLNEFLYGTDISSDIDDIPWSIDKTRINDTLNPRQETYVYLVSEYWSQYTASADVLVNNGSILIFLRNSGDVALNIADCEIRQFSVNYSDYLLDKFTERPRINYQGLTWGMSYEDVKAIVDFDASFFNWTDSTKRYAFDINPKHKIYLDFDIYDRFCGVTVVAND